jgi:hypothetical protein
MVADPQGRCGAHLDRAHRGRQRAAELMGAIAPYSPGGGRRPRYRISASVAEASHRRPASHRPSGWDGSAEEEVELVAVELAACRP